MADPDSRWATDKSGKKDASDLPTWFQWAMAQTPSSHFVCVDSCPIHYLKWNQSDAKSNGLLFLHGGGAHAQWWSFIAPFFAAKRPVAAIDFSGMGESGHRSGEYGSTVHIPEIKAVLEEAGLGGHPVVVGHSFGGYMTMSYAYKYGATLSGAVIIDAAIRPGTEDLDTPPAAYDRPKRYYSDKKTIVDRYRLMPEQPTNNPFLLDHVADHSVRKETEGWTWKFDAAARGAAHYQEPLSDYVRNLPCRKAFIYGAESKFMTPIVLKHMTTLFGLNDPMIAVPSAHHHLTMDQPIAFIVALRTILSGWDL